MQKKLKKMLAAMLALVMAMSLMVPTAFANETEETADQTAEERGADPAPVLSMEGGAVVVRVVLRLVMRRGRRRGRTGDLVPGRRTRGSSMSHCGCPSGRFRRMRRLPDRSRRLDLLPDRRGSLRRLRLLHRRLHRRRRLPLGQRASFRCSHRRSAKSAADRERHHHLLYCLVHCRVPFVFRASPFSRLHRDRRLRPNFLTKIF